MVEEMMSFGMKFVMWTLLALSALFVVLEMFFKPGFNQRLAMAMLVMLRG